MKVLYMYPAHDNRSLREALQISEERHISLVALEYDPSKPEAARTEMKNILSKETCDGIISQHENPDFCTKLTSAASLPIVFANVHLTVGNFSMLLNFINALRSNISLNLSNIVHITEKASRIDTDRIFSAYGIRFSEIVTAQPLTDSEWEHLRNEGCNCVLCPPEFFEKARAYGMIPFYVDALLSYTGLRQAFRAMADILQLNSLTLRQNRAMRQMVDYAFEAMLVVEKSGEIQFYNASAGKLFHLPEVIENNTARLSDLFPDITAAMLSQVFDKGEKLYGFRAVANQQVCTINMVPFEGTDGIRSALLHCDAEKKEESEETERNHEPGNRTARYFFKDILGESGSLLQAKHQAEQFAKYDSNVLLLGESGCGKELFAQSIHNASVRRKGPFVAVNCGAISMSLLESELFGYVEGAFTGASRHGKKGAFEMANNGTIFLDEISTLEFSGQSRLLRVLEDRLVTRVGGTQHIPVNVRIIAASNEDLARMVQEGKFRKDLYYRLNVLTVVIPPVRNRPGDSVILMENFLKRFSERYSKDVSMTPECREIIRNFPWDGNVRQIRNFAERIVVIATDRQVKADFVREQLQQTYQGTPQGKNAASRQFAGELGNDPDSVDPAEKATSSRENTNRSSREEESRSAILHALRVCGGSKKKAAAMLGISYPTLWRRMKQQGITETFS